MILLVAEKPSVATGHYKEMIERCTGDRLQKKDGYLIGKDHAITWCVGHLVTLAPFDQYEGYDGFWKLGNLPLIPKQFRLMPIERTQKQLNIVTNLMKEATSLVNGADAGREGNLIFDLVIDKNPELKEKEIKRLWVNSFVDKDLDKAWSNLELAKKRENLSFAARLRQRADWLVGLNATRAYTLTAGRGKLISVGRVQTPTLNLVVKRDEEVEGFEELFFYGIEAKWRGFSCHWYEEGKKAFHDTPAYPERVIAKCSNQDAKITILKKSTKRKFPPKPFDLTDLQKEVNKRFKIKVARTLEIAQKLYESKFITYPRTDSAYLTEGMKKESYELAQKLAAENERSLIRDYKESFAFINDKKVTDHYAIIPTGVDPRNLTDEESKVYSLVKSRFIQAWLKPMVWEEINVSLDCKEEFRMILKKEISLGYKAIANENEDKEADSEEEKDEPSNKIKESIDWKKGDVDPLTGLEVNKKKKSKPKYFTEATLLAAMKLAGKTIDDEELAEAMKERGLGTPATQAGIIETLKSRGFIVEDKNKIRATEEGHRLIRVVDEQLKSAEMTGEWEYKLSQIERGEYDPGQFKEDIVLYVQNVFSQLRERYSNDFERDKIKPEFDCPKCSKKLETKNWGYVCDDACGFKFGHTIAERSLSIEEITDILGKKELKDLEGFRSKKGFAFKAGLKLNSEFEVEFVFDGERTKVERKEKCPVCKDKLGETEKVISCNGGPHGRCKFVLFKTVASYALEEKEIKALLAKKKTDLITTFKSKKGSDFSARLSMDSNSKVVFEFEANSAPKTLQSSGKLFRSPCPVCKEPLKDTSEEIYCSDSRCRFSLNKLVYNRPLSDSELESLIVNKKTEVLSGFKSPKGNDFFGVLTLKDDYSVKLNWDLKENENLIKK